MLIRIFSSLVLMLLVGYSNFVRAIPSKLWKREIDPELFGRLELFSQYSAAAYCFANNDSPNTKVLCAQRNCPRVEQAETLTTLEFQQQGSVDGTGFVATDTTNSLIVISFRGSSSDEDWATNIDVGLEDFGVCNRCRAHGGFNQVWNNTRVDVLRAVNRARTQNPTFKVVATGHSQGGAVAALAVAEMRSWDMEVDLYTYGAPKCANRELAAFIAEEGKGENFRLVHDRDPIPLLPPGIPFFFDNYEHFNPELFIARDRGLDTTAADVVEIEDGEDGNRPGSFTAHKQYFGAITACLSEEEIQGGGATPTESAAEPAEVTEEPRTRDRIRGAFSAIKDTLLGK